MTKKILVADLLCGAGGSSTGAELALLELGFSPADYEFVCVNHWPTAIKTHSINHPRARHYVQDIATGRPHIMVPEGYLDLLMASPTCTHHSVARGGKPTSDQQRSDPWHIITWLTELRVRRMIIENVWEFCGWGPVNPKTGKPIRERRGEYFLAWIETIKRLGFEPEWRKLNAADYGDATTRARFILMARSDGRKVAWPMPSHQKRAPGGADLFDAGRPWRPAAEIIDWSIRGRSIFNRPKPLAPKTLARIFVGAVKFEWPEPFIRLLMFAIEQSLLFHIRWSFNARNTPATSNARRKRMALVRDLIARLRHFRVAPMEFGRGGRHADPMLVTLRRNGSGTSIDGPLPTITASGLHVGIAEPLIISPRHGKDGAGPRPRVVGQPLPTITAGGSQMAMAEPVIVNMKGRSTASGVTAPLPTQTACAPHLFTAEPIILSQHNSGSARSTLDPLPTITTGGAATEERPGCARPMLVEPFVLSQASGGAPRSANDPLPTATTGGAGGAHALISPYYGSGSGETCVSVEEPLPTVTAKGRFGMVVPVTHSNGGNGARDVAEPIPTLTTAKGGEFAVVLPVTHAGDGDRSRPVSDPLPTITGANRGELAVVQALGEYDILFRMLEPHELAAAMGFNANGTNYKFAGTKTQMIKQIGNAVSVRKMKACVGAIMADAAPRRRAAGPREFREAAE